MGKASRAATQQAISLRDALEAVNLESGQPDWWSPGDMSMLEGEQFARESGVDPVVGVGMIKRFRGPNAFRDAKAFFSPTRRLVKSPEATVPGMNAAGAELAQVIAAGGKIAVFGDYDPDGTTAVAAFTRAVTPYISHPCTKCGGRKNVDCFECGGTGMVPEKGRLHIGYANAQEGFGLTTDFVNQAAAAGCDVLVTLDCGSTQVTQVKQAQALGMKVVVVDHHQTDPANPAEHHLNPYLHGDDQSPNTGSVLAWKLGAAVQQAIDGRTRPEYWEQAMYLAGFGCRADMGTLTDLEHRAFFRCPLEAKDPVPPGLRMLSERLGEDPLTPAGGVKTSAALNLPKRSRLVDAQTVGELLNANSRAQAHEHVEKLLEAYENAKPVRKAMNQAATDANSGLSEFNDRGHCPQDERIAHAVIDGFEDYSGYAGSVASNLARETGRPAIVFTRKGTDPDGRDVYKFAMRSERKTTRKIGDLIPDPAMRAACEVTRLDEAGEREDAPSIGGHPDVVSGNCYGDNIPAVLAAVNEWSAGFNDYKWFPKAGFSGEAYVVERRVPQGRYRAIKEQAEQLAPFSFKDRHTPVNISVVGVISDIQEPEDGSRYANATLTMGQQCDTVTISLDRAANLPEDGAAEYVVSVGDGTPFIRTWHDPRAAGDAKAA